MAGNSSRPEVVHMHLRPGVGEGAEPRQRRQPRRLAALRADQDSAGKVPPAEFLQRRDGLHPGKGPRQPPRPRAEYHRRRGGEGRQRLGQRCLARQIPAGDAQKKGAHCPTMSLAADPAGRGKRIRPDTRCASDAEGAAQAVVARHLQADHWHPRADRMDAIVLALADQHIQPGDDALQAQRRHLRPPEGRDRPAAAPPPAVRGRRWRGTGGSPRGPVLPPTAGG